MTLQKDPLWHVAACDLYSDAQAHQYDDLAISSLENAYTVLHRNQSATSAKFYESLDGHLRAKLDIHFRFYARWCRPFDYRDCSTLAENPHHNLTYADLRQKFPALRKGISNDPAALQDLRGSLLEVIDSCSAPEQVYYRVIARRSLASILSEMQQPGRDQAISQYEKAIIEARNSNLESELGHLYRHYGWTLSMAGCHEQAIQSLEAAYSHDEHPVFSYWRALDACELGDAWLRRAARANAPAQPPTPLHKSSSTQLAIAMSNLAQPLLERALEAYRAGRLHFQQHLLSAHLPVGKAVKLQMFRSYTENAIQIAATLDRGADILAELELHTPHEVAEALVIAESAREIGSGTAQEVREKWERFHRHLNTVPGDFDQYLASIPQDRDARQQYVRTRLRLAPRLAALDLSDSVVKQLTPTRIPGVNLLFFYVGPERSWAVLWMGDTGNVAVIRNRFLYDSVLRDTHGSYNKAVALALSLKDPRIALQSTVDQLLTAHTQLLGPVFEQFLPQLRGRHLKVFPVMQLSSVPMHAIPVNGSPLINWCDVSYCQSLGLFEQLHAREKPGEGATLGMVFDDHNAPLFEGIVAKLSACYQSRFSLMRSPNWDALRLTLSEHPPDDLLFACHGNYDPSKPAQSSLGIGTAEGVSFTRLFTELNLANIRSVTMGACESGLGRAELSSEYIGLPNVFLSAGVRYVVGSLWRVNALATAVLLGNHFELLVEGTRTVPIALNGAQRAVKTMTRDGLKQWVHERLPQWEQDYASQIDELDSLPFAHPYYWAGFYVSGAL